ncbi:hypothetical protein [Roseivivax sp. CAU 1753]
MLFSLLTIAVIGVSVVVITKNFRMIAADTMTSLRTSLGQVFANGRALSNAAFGLLWLLFFGLCFA